MKAFLFSLVSSWLVLASASTHAAILPTMPLSAADSLENIYSGNLKNEFSINSTVVVAEIFDIAALDPVMDDKDGDGYFAWQSYWYDPLGASYLGNLVTIAWEDIMAMQANNLPTYLVSESSTSIVSSLSTGEWSVASYAEGQEVSALSFNVSSAEVSEPSTWMLLMTVMLFLIRKHKFY